MEPHAFVAELYRRMSLRNSAERSSPTWAEMQTDRQVQQIAWESASLLPPDKRAAVLDIGFGGGKFLAACLKLGYSNLSGAEFGIEHKAHVKKWNPEAIQLFAIETNIGDFLSGRKEQYDFIHLSHVIEHIPKYSLLWVTDALFWALKPGGTVLLRTPNMEGPCANSSFYVTLAHEYGFSGSNFRSLLHICGFDDIRFHRFPIYKPTVKQQLGVAIRQPFLKFNEVKHRLFGVNQGGQFGSELVATAKRGSAVPLFDPKYR